MKQAPEGWCLPPGVAHNFAEEVNERQQANEVTCMQVCKEKLMYLVRQPDRNRIYSGLSDLSPHPYGNCARAGEHFPAAGRGRKRHLDAFVRKGTPTEPRIHRVVGERNCPCARTNYRAASTADKAARSKGGRGRDIIGVAIQDKDCISSVCLRELIDRRKRDRQQLRERVPNPGRPGRTAEDANSLSFHHAVTGFGDRRSGLSDR